MRSQELLCFVLLCDFLWQISPELLTPTAFRAVAALQPSSGVAKESSLSMLDDLNMAEVEAGVVSANTDTADFEGRGVLK